MTNQTVSFLFNNVVNQVHDRISNENQLPATNNGFDTLNSSAPPLDTDPGGMPDFWEQALCFSTTTDDHDASLNNCHAMRCLDTHEPSAGSWCWRRECESLDPEQRYQWRNAITPPPLP